MKKSKLELLFCFGWNWLDRRRRHIGKSCKVRRAIETIHQLNRPISELKRELIEKLQ